MPANHRRIISYENPNSIISESYKTLRTNVLWSLEEKPLRTLLVTSPEPGAGKSTTVVNIAVSFAQLGKKVLIIDSDMRKPTQHDYFLKTNHMGLFHVLARQCPVQQCLLDTHIENLTLLPSGSIPPNPAELLSSPRFSALIEELSVDYEIIVVDSPPLLAVTDAQVLATRCDGVILVLKSGKTKKQFAQKALSALKHVNANILGVVLNQKPLQKSDIAYPYGG